MGKRKVHTDGSVTVEHKNANGAGSISTRKDGRLEGRAVLPDGRRKVVYGKSNAEVLSKLQALQGDIQHGEPIPAGRETVEQFFARWLRDVAKQRVRPSTFTYYSDVVRLHIAPAIGKRRLTELTPKLLQEFLNSLTTAELLGGWGRRKAKPAAPLGPRSVAHVRGILRTALERAVREGLIARNVAKLVDAPRYEAKAVEALTATAARAIIEAFSGHEYECLITVALATGMRRGELLGLQWADVDFEAGTVRIERQAQRRHGKHELVPLKTARSRRTLALPVVAVEALRRHKLRQSEARLSAGPAWQDTGLLFTTATGTALHGSTVTHRFENQLREKGLPVRRFHDLRHGAASLLLAQGANMRSVMEQLGHSQISLTMNTYAHISPEILRGNAAKLDGALSAAASA